MSVQNINYNEQVLSFALDFGKKLLESGYEVTKSQDTMERICKNYKATQVDFFVIPSEINSTIKFEDSGHISQMREITKSSTNLFMIEKLNALSRKICSEDISLEQAKEIFNQTIKLKPYNNILVSIGAGLGTGGFSIFFGGTLLDGLFAFLIGVLAFYLFDIFSNYFSKVAVSFIVSFIDGVLAIIVYKLGLCNNLDMVMIGVIMTMIPGMSFGNSVKDLLIGNTISGILTIINAVLIATAIASGLAISISLFSSGYVITYNVVIADWIKILSGMIGTLGFGLLFCLEAKKLSIVSIGGFFTTLVLVISEKIIPQNAQYFILFTVMIASMFALLICEILARTLKAPTAIFLLPFLIPLVPGGSLFRTMFCLIKGDYSQSGLFFKNTIETGLGIATGLVLFGIVLRVVFYTIKILKNKHQKLKNK